MKFSITSFFLFFLVQGFSQNLILNGSFEEENICTEYKVNCAPEAWIHTSNGFGNYFKDASLAHSGSHCMAVQAGHSNRRYNRTFIRSQLICGLRKGHIYRLEFFVKSPHKIVDSIGVYFTPHDFLFEKKLPSKLTPAIFAVDGLEKPVTGDTNWQKLSFNYTATGDEAFIAIGNFSKRDITGPTGRDKENNFFVLIDDVSFKATNPNEKLCIDWRKNSTEIYEMNERHEYLTRFIQYYRNKPPESKKLALTLLQTIDTLIVPDVLFTTGSSQLQKNSFQLLDSFCKTVDVKQIDSLVIEGHTDSTGSFTLNAKLSLERAQSVGNYLSSKLNLNESNLIMRGNASYKPIADNKTSVGRQKNRRVEIILYKKD